MGTFTLVGAFGVYKEYSRTHAAENAEWKHVMKENVLSALFYFWLGCACFGEVGYGLSAAVGDFLGVIAWLITLVRLTTACCRHGERRKEEKKDEHKTNEKEKTDQPDKKESNDLEQPLLE